MVYEFERKMQACSLIFAALLASAALHAQPGAATLRGQVIGPAGEVVPGAVVAAIAEEGRVRLAVTNEQGRYAIQELRPGTYIIWAREKGFSLYENDDLEIKRGQAQTLDILLTPNPSGRLPVLRKVANSICLRPGNCQHDRSRPPGKLRRL
jgi:hypothetical protein